MSPPTPTPTSFPLPSFLTTFLTPINPSGQLTTITDLTTLPGVLLNTTFFIFTWSFLYRYIQRNGPVAIVRDTTLPLHTKSYSLLSLVFLLALLQSLAQTQASTMLPTFLRTELLPVIDLQKLRYLYHYSKYYEQFLDTLLLVASGRSISPHMAFHHLTMPVYTLFRTLRCSGDGWVFFTICNLFHHVLLCAYLGGIPIGVTRRVLHYTQMLQLGVGVGVDAWWFWEHRDMIVSGRKGEREAVGGLMADREQLGRAVSILLLTRFAQLYWRESRAGLGGQKKGKGKVTAKDTEKETKKSR